MKKCPKNQTDDYCFNGIESLGFEFFGRLPLNRARELAGTNIDFVMNDKSNISASVLFIQIDKLRIKKAPFIRFSYPEILWLLDVILDDKPAKLTVKAHTNPMMYFALSKVDKYNTSLAKIGFDFSASVDSFLSVQTKGEKFLHVEFSETSKEAESPSIQRLFTCSKSGSLYEIPWGGHHSETTTAVDFHINDRSLLDQVFGHEFEILDQAFIYKNRPHACSPALRVPITIL